MKGGGEYQWSSNMKNPQTSLFLSSFFGLDQRGGKKEQHKKLNGAK